MKVQFLFFVTLQLFVKGFSNAQIDSDDDNSEDSDSTSGGSMWCSDDNGWHSEIRETIIANESVVRLSWKPLPSTLNGSTNYSVLLFNMDFSNEVKMTVKRTNSTIVQITSLEYDEEYTAFVCYNASDSFLNNIMSSYTKFMPQCGYCFTTFTLQQSSTVGAPTLETLPTTLKTSNATSEPLNLQGNDDISEHTVILMSTLPVTSIVAMVLIIGIALVYKYAKMKERIKAMESSYLSVTGCESAFKKGDVLMEKLRLPEEIFISPSNLCVSVVIGQGEFGVIYKGILKSKDGATQTEVAVKTIRGIFTTGSDMDAMTKEISRMSQFDHLNVMTLIGVCMAPSGPAKESANTSIVMPFMAKGSLLDYLRKESEHLCTANQDEALKVRKPLVQICHQIAKGMEYLAGQKYVHRDLAARNCLVDENFVIKVSDFGLTEKTYSQNYFRQAVGGAKLPVKWMAIESIKFGVYSEKTDVWSYGVTCWEVFSGGAVPYPGTHPREILAFLEDGGRLLKPANEALFDKMNNVMQSCWKVNKDSRPTFSAIVHILETYLATVSNYTDLSNLMTGREEEPKPKLSMSISHGFINRIAMATRDSYNNYYVADV